MLAFPLQFFPVLGEEKGEVGGHMGLSVCMSYKQVLVILQENTVIHTLPIGFKLT